MEYDLAQQAIASGAETAAEIADYVANNGGPQHEAHVRRELRQMVMDGHLERDTSTTPHRYSVPGDSAPDPAPAPTPDPADDPDPADGPDPDAGQDDDPDPADPGTSIMVERSYDWDGMVRDGEYVSQDSELGFIDARARINDAPPHTFLLSGPTGCGKTTLAETLSGRRDAPLLSIQCYEGLHEGDLVGRFVPQGPDKVKWQDGPLTKALLASREREVILLVDELNRARPGGKAVLYSALDHRAQVEIPQLGETVRGNPDNLIILATVNLGREYQVNPMDPAERGRFDEWVGLTHLGREHPDREAKLLVDRTPASREQAVKMVEAANSTRDLEDDGDITMGVTTRSLLNWAASAAAWAEAGGGNPWMKAAEGAVLEPIYGGQKRDQNGHDRAREIIRSTFDGAPFDHDRFIEFVEG